MFNKAGRSHANGEAYKVAGKVTVHVLQELLAGIAFHSVQFGITKVRKSLLFIVYGSKFFICRHTLAFVQLST